MKCVLCFLYLTICICDSESEDGCISIDILIDGRLVGSLLEDRWKLVPVYIDGCCSSVSTTSRGYALISTFNS